MVCSNYGVYSPFKLAQIPLGTIFSHLLGPKLLGLLDAWEVGYGHENAHVGGLWSLCFDFLRCKDQKYKKSSLGSSSSIPVDTGDNSTVTGTGVRSEH